MKTSKLTNNYENMKTSKVNSLSEDDRVADLIEIIDSEELNSMEFDEAIKEDNRSFCRIFIDMLKEKQIIILTLFSDNIFYPLFLRIVMLAFTISIYLFLNALLYNESYIEDRYTSSKTDFFYLINEELEKSIYASVISMVISRLLNFLVSSSSQYKTIYDKLYGTEEFEPECKQVIKTMKIKQITTFAILILVNCICWY